MTGELATTRRAPFNAYMEPRLKSHIRVGAHIRRAQAGGAFATIARRGDEDAGVVLVKIFQTRDAARVLFEARDEFGNHIWRDPFEGVTDEASVDKFIEKEVNLDPDVWVLEIEDRDGRSFLET